MGLSQTDFELEDMADQNERAFQKQPTIFLGRKRVLGKSKKTKSKTGGLRYYKNVGLGIKTPKEAIDGNYIDKKMSICWKRFHSWTYLKRSCRFHQNEQNHHCQT